MISTEAPSGLQTQEQRLILAAADSIIQAKSRLEVDDWAQHMAINLDVEYVASDGRVNV